MGNKSKAKGRKAAHGNEEDTEIGEFSSARMKQTQFAEADLVRDEFSLQPAASRDEEGTNSETRIGKLHRRKAAMDVDVDEEVFELHPQSSDLEEDGDEEEAAAEDEEDDFGDVEAGDDDDDDVIGRDSEEGDEGITEGWGQVRQA